MKIEKVTELIYEATRLEAIWSKRSIVPEKWEERDEKFRKQMIEIIVKYLGMEQLPTPEEAHNSWMKSYFEMGWKYGEKRNAEKKTHPDLVPFYDLPQDERDKDAIFLALVWLTKNLNIHHNQTLVENIKGWLSFSYILGNSMGKIEYILKFASSNTFWTTLFVGISIGYIIARFLIPFAK